MTIDTWHLTPDTQHMNILSKFQLSSCYALDKIMFWRFGGKGSLS